MLSKSTLQLLKSNQDNMRQVRGLGRMPKDTPDLMSRYSGGQGRKTHPYISGYWYAIFKLPTKIFNYSRNTIDSYYLNEKWLHSAIEAFNPPSANPTKFDVPAMGGLGASFIGGNQYTRTFSCDFREYMDTPISSIISHWNNIVDRYYGASNLDADEYIPASYKGWAAVFICKPSVSGSAYGSGATSSTTFISSVENIEVKDIERAFIFEGVFPETNPFDSFSSDISTNDGLRFSVTFSFDGWAMDKDRPDILRTALDSLKKNANFSTRTLKLDPARYLNVINDPSGNAG